MCAEEKLAIAAEHLREIDAALQHIDRKLAGAEEELTAKVADKAPAPRIRPQPQSPPAVARNAGS